MATLHTQTHKAAKVIRSRTKMRAAGLRPVQFWVTDTRSVGFAEKMRLQCQSLKGSQSEREALQFAESAADLIQGWQ
jgi:Protein  of unknown function (DUF3018)